MTTLRRNSRIYGALAKFIYVYCFAIGNAIINVKLVIGLRFISKFRMVMPLPELWLMTQ